VNNLASDAPTGAAAPVAGPSARSEAYGAWLAALCGSIRDAQSGVAVLGAPDLGPYAPVAYWPRHREGAPRLADVAELALAERRVVVDLLPPPPGSGNPAPLSRGLALPIDVDGHLHGVVAIEVAERSDAELQLVLQALRLGLNLIAAQLREHSKRETLATEERLMALVDLTASVLEEEQFEPACRSFVTELAMRLFCDRVSIGVVRRGHAEVVALSHSAQIGKRMDLARALGAAMDEAIDQKTVIRFPAAAGDEIVVTRDHERLAREHGNGSLLTLPMAGAGDFAAALCCERAGNMPFEPADVELCQSVAAVVARILELKKRNERALAMRIKDAWQEQVQRMVGPRYFKRKLVLGTAVLAVVFFSFATGDYRVTAPATLEGAVRRTLAAPFDGYIASAPARAGDVARADAVLATLDDREMRLERLKWASQHAQYLKQHQEAVANRDRAKAQILQALYDQAQAQINLLDEQLARAAVKAPFDGVIVKGDLSQSLGAGVKRGDVLFEITPLESYRVIVEVDEREIADVARGEKGQLILAAISGESFPFTVSNVTSVTTAREGRNYFRVEAMLDQANDRLRPGMEGVGKIHVDRRRLIWIWTHRLQNWIRLFVWSYLP